MRQFTDKDWEFLQQLETVLQRFYEHTEYVSRSAPQISYAVPIYYDLHDLINDAANREGEFINLHGDIATAVSSALKTYSKYYDFMDNARPIIQHIKEVLNQEYPPIASSIPSSGSIVPLRQTLEARLLAKIQHSTSLTSDIDRYFNDPLAQISEDASTNDPNWLFNWWNGHKDEYPRMSAAARDYLAIPASEVSCERLFSAGRDMIGLRRFSLSPNTMRQLALLRNSIRSKAIDR
jgi:hAT family protein